MRITVNVDARLFARRDADRIAAHVRQTLAADPELQAIAAVASDQPNAAVRRAALDRAVRRLRRSKL